MEINWVRWAETRLGCKQSEWLAWRKQGQQLTVILPDGRKQRLELPLARKVTRKPGGDRRRSTHEPANLAGTDARFAGG